MIGFLILLFIFVAGFFIMQMLIYRFVKKNIHKYTKIKWFHMWLHMNMKKKDPRLDFFVFCSYSTRMYRMENMAASFYIIHMLIIFSFIIK